jgi:hypothetical protein
MTQVLPVSMPFSCPLLPAGAHTGPPRQGGGHWFEPRIAQWVVVELASNSRERRALDRLHRPCRRQQQLNRANGCRSELLEVLAAGVQTVLPPAANQETFTARLS